MRIEATAPAKLVLLGEYAVLEGAPALVAAVNREVRVTLEPSPDRVWHIRTDLGGGRHGTLEVTADPALVPDWMRPVATVLGRLSRTAGRTPADLRPQRVSIESAALFVDAGGTKLGLGSSAAVITALSAAVHALLATEGPSPEHELAHDLAAHRELAAGHGSGVDVAASRIGGILAYQLLDGVPHVESVVLPAGLVFGVIWTGTSTSTSHFVARVQAWKAREPEAYAEQIARMRRLSERAVGACRDGDAHLFLGLVRAYREAMGELGEASGVPILSEAHAAINHFAENEGAAYKPSGAGGGDVGVLFARSERALVQAARMAERAGYRLLSLDIQPEGVTVRSEEIPSS